MNRLWPGKHRLILMENKKKKSQYPNMGLLMNNRDIVIKNQNGKCAHCEDKGFHIHHKDLTKTNHSVENLIYLCASCHGKLHAKMKGCAPSKPTSWRRLSIRFPDSVFEKLKISAAREKRSVNAEINIILEKSLSDIQDIKQGKTQIDVSSLDVK